MLIRRPLKIVTGVIVGLTLIFMGFAIFMARVTVYPTWYRASAVGKELPECSSYQNRVYVHCHDPRKSLGLEYTSFEAERRVEGKLVRVSGWWVWSSHAKESRGIVVLVHGGGADRRAMLKHVKYLHEAGYHALLIDCHNHGLNHSDQRGISLGLWESESIIAAVDWASTHIRQLGDAGDGAAKALPLPIAVMGTSQGAFAALRAAARSDLIGAVVAENPYVSVRRVVSEFPTMYWLPRVVKESALALVTAWMGHSVWALDVSRFAEHVGQKPVLLVHGADDQITPLSHSEEIKQLLPGPTQLWAIPDGEHEYLWNIMGERYEKRIVDFLGEALSPPKVQ